MQDSQNNIDLARQWHKRTRAVGFGHKVGGLLLFGNRDAAGNPASPIYRQYGHMMSCNSRLIQENGTIRGVQHCKCKACTQCNRTRTAVLIDKYQPILEQQKELYFITLTRRNVHGAELKAEIHTYFEQFHKMMLTRYFRKRIAPDKENARILKKIESADAKIRFWSESMFNNNGSFIDNKTRTRRLNHFEMVKAQAEQELANINQTPLLGLRKLECTYHSTKYLTRKDKKGNIIGYVKDAAGNLIDDPWYDTYHPHFHLVCNSLEVAEWFKSEWLRLNEGYAEVQSQDIRKCTSGEYLKELFKYFSKTVTKQIDGYRLDPVSLDTILVAMDGVRIFQRFGKDELWKCPEVDEDNIEEEAIAVDEQDNDTFIFLDEGEWGSGSWSYVSYETGRILASVLKRGPLCKMFQDTERDVGFDAAKAEEIRKEVYWEPQPKRYNPMPDIKAHLRKKKQKTLQKQ